MSTPVIPYVMGEPVELGFLPAMNQPLTNLTSVGGQIAQSYFARSTAKTQARAARDVGIAQHQAAVSIARAEQNRMRDTGVEWAKNASKIALYGGAGLALVLGARLAISLLIPQRSRSG